MYRASRYFGNRVCYACVLIAAAVLAPGALAADEALLCIEDAPEHGLVVTHVDLAGLLGEAPVAVQAALRESGKPVLSQFVPDAWDAMQGTLVLQLPGGGSHELTLSAAPEAPPPAQPATTARTQGCTLSFVDDRKAGAPAAYTFDDTGKNFASFVWNDRVYQRELGCFHLRYDTERQPVVAADGDLCTVVRVAAHYCNAAGERPASQPEAVYDWYAFKALPLVYVTAQVRQAQPFDWTELHFLELNFPDESFVHFAGGEPASSGALTATNETTIFPQWGALVNGQDAIGFFGCGPIRCYDGRGGYGTYLHATWQQPWRERSSRLAAWLWAGHAEAPAKAVAQAAQDYGVRGRAVLTRPALHAAIDALRAQAETLPPAFQAATRWLAALATQSEARGRLDEAETLAQGGLPPGWSAFAAGDLKLTLRRDAAGITLHSLFDTGCARELLAPDPLPLFTLKLRKPDSEETAVLDATSGWKSASIEETADGFALHWRDPVDARFAGISVSATARADQTQPAWRWTIAVDAKDSAWSVEEVTFPQLALAEPGDGAAVLFPRGPGEEKRGVWQDGFRFQGRYPSGWCSMPLLATYAKDASTGLYVAVHDPYGSTREIELAGMPERESVHFVFAHPAPDMGRASNGFALSGEAVWQLLRGDWFDAATIYKAWAQREAKWWPELGVNGREDTPLWLRELCVWAQTGGAPGECVPGVKAFAEFLGVPAGFHWYNWHQIPFDNDYPHYFPTKPGFAEGVRELQENNVYVMPYINGRLWDTHDRQAEDFEFTSVALPAVSKDEHGKPYTETYHSKEEDGAPVRLGVMCPATALWQQRVKDIVLRLQNEEGVKGVYIDQIAAASPTLCMDPAHGHPLGGGHWWTQGYWALLEGIRSEMQPDRMITTECNAEPYIRWMDGYLTWHWQYDGQVPVFPAVYGGAIQMFGRAYGGGATRDLALRMKAAQQLVFGEQLGWLSPALVNESPSFEFFRRAVGLRWQLRRYFYAGEMARPPKLSGDIPSVTADWQWHGIWPVTTSALLTGAWRIPAENRLVLLFANVADAPSKPPSTSAPNATASPPMPTPSTSSAVPTTPKKASISPPPSSTPSSSPRRASAHGNGTGKRYETPPRRRLASARHTAYYGRGFERIMVMEME